MTKVFTDGLSFALPLLIMAVGAIYSEKSGVTNLAVEGFQGFGAFIGALAAVLLMPHLDKSSQIPIYVAMLFAAIGGGVYACIHALLCINFKANQVISGVVVNILAVALTTFFTSAANTALAGTASNKFILGVSNRYSIPLLSKIPWIGERLFGNTNDDLKMHEMLLVVTVNWAVDESSDGVEASLNELKDRKVEVEMP